MSHPVVFRPLQARFLSIPQAPLCYWLRERFFELLRRTCPVSGHAEIGQGLSTADNARFVRWFWETLLPDPRWKGWYPFEKGGGYKRWYGNQMWATDWREDGARTKLHVSEAYPYLKGNWGFKIQSTHLYFKKGFVYTETVRGCLGVRFMEAGRIFDFKAPGIFPLEKSFWRLIEGLNCRLAGYLLRTVSPTMEIAYKYLEASPAFVLEADSRRAYACVSLERWRIASSPTEWSFSARALSKGDLRPLYLREVNDVEAVAAVLHTLEGLSEREVFAAYGIAGEDLQAVLDETGTPAGWFPLIAGYDTIPPLPRGLTVDAGLLAPLAREERRTLSPEALADLKRRLRAFYEAGRGAKVDEGEDASDGDDEDDGEESEAAVSGARIPIPAETFLEELSQKLEVHPISVYWLLRELREKEGVVCQPELERFVEDYVSVTVLRLLGHRWPKEIEAGDRLPAWADSDGVIPLTEGVGEPTLLQRVRERIAEDFGPDRVNVIEQEFRQIFGTSLGAWLATQFFPRHISQFKKRPIAWHIQSTRGDGQRGRRGRANAPPAFSCLVYYHRLDGDLLPKLRSQYVGPLRTRIQTELGGLERLEARTADQDERRVQLERLLDELKDFDSRLEQVITAGFRAPVLASIAAKEPLDKWTSRDGRAPHPTTREAFWAQEQRYDPDLNDGVRVNVAPLQRAELLAVDVLAAKDVEKAIADRASWRADERRWCREGKLPQPGWWPSKEPAGVAPKTRVEARQ